MVKRAAGRPPRTWVGWREWVALPELEIDRLKAKIDTGAATSALHAIHVRRFVEHGRARVAFEVHPLQRDAHVTRQCVADVYEERVVTSSNGHRERRPVIRTMLAVAGQCYRVELTLTNRDTMGFRLLIGRRAMKGRLLVDPAASFLAGAADSEALPRRRAIR